MNTTVSVDSDGRSVAKNFGDVILEPSATFEDVAERPRWLVPLIVIAVAKIVPAVELRSRTLEIAGTMADKSPATLALAKRALRAALEMPLSAGLEQERDLFALAFATDDKVEGVQAFLEKRKPEWRGR